MKETVYIFSSGALKRKENTLSFVSDEGTKYIPVEQVREIYAFGEVDINKRVLEFLARKEIMLSYFNYYGYYVGSFYPREHHNSGFMILRQAEAYLDEGKRMHLARQFVSGASKNCLKILKYYNRREKELEGAIAEIEELNEGIDATGGIDQLMSIEGKIKKIYYSCFNVIIDNPDFCFTGRTKRPPGDSLNALISFANSIIYTAMLSEIYQTHLDPRIGFLHATNFRRFTLNLDVAEIFKPVIGDRTIFSALNKNIITAGDFEKDLNGILLNDRGKKKFLEQLEEHFKQTIRHSKMKKNVSYRRLMRLELYRLEKHLMGEDDYSPFVMDW